MKDLTKIKTPFGLLKPKVRNAMHEHHDAGGTIQCYSVHGWMDCEPDWTEYHVYRVKPAENKTVAALREEFKTTSARYVCMPADTPIFAAVKEWQEARANMGKDGGSIDRWQAALNALAAIKVPS